MTGHELKKALNEMSEQELELEVYFMDIRKTEAFRKFTKDITVCIDNYDDQKCIFIANDTKDVLFKTEKVHKFNETPNQNKANPIRSAI